MRNLFLTGFNVVLLHPASNHLEAEAGSALFCAFAHKADFHPFGQFRSVRLADSL